MTRRVPADAGIEHHWAVSEPIETSRGREVDDVITRCDDARAVGPVVRGAHQSRHWGGPDPSRTRGEDAARLASDERALTDLAERVGHFFTIAERQDPLASA